MYPLHKKRIPSAARRKEVDGRSERVRWLARGSRAAGQRRREGEGCSKMLHLPPFAARKRLASFSVAICRQTAATSRLGRRLLCSARAARPPPRFVPSRCTSRTRRTNTAPAASACHTKSPHKHPVWRATPRPPKKRQRQPCCGGSAQRAKGQAAAAAVPGQLLEPVRQRLQRLAAHGIGVQGARLGPFGLVLQVGGAALPLPGNRAHARAHTQRIHVERPTREGRHGSSVEEPKNAAPAKGKDRQVKS